MVACKYTNLTLKEGNKDRGKKFIAQVSEEIIWEKHPSFSEVPNPLFA